MNTAKSFEDLIVWQKSHQFVIEVYRFSKGFPKEELFSLTSQLRRAAVSIAANIAEGFRKRGHRDKARYFNIAQGSVSECLYYLILAKDLDYGYNQKLFEILNEVSRMLLAYYKALTRNNL
jgi:four helix bundle protein